MTNLYGVHPRLRRVVEEAIRRTPVDFGVTEGLRTYSRQVQMFNAGATQTMNSRHLTGHAVDLVAYVGNRISWEMPYYKAIKDVMFEVAAEMDVELEWGGDWKTFKDGPHFQLSWKRYPAGRDV